MPDCFPDCFPSVPDCFPSVPNCFPDYFPSVPNCFSDGLTTMLIWFLRLPYYYADLVLQLPYYYVDKGLRTKPRTILGTVKNEKKTGRETENRRLWKVRYRLTDTLQRTNVTSYNNNNVDKTNDDYFTDWAVNEPWAPRTGSARLTWSVRDIIILWSNCTTERKMAEGYR